MDDASFSARGAHDGAYRHLAAENRQTNPASQERAPAVRQPGDAGDAADLAFVIRDGTPADRRSGWRIRLEEQPTPMSGRMTAKVQAADRFLAGGAALPARDTALLIEAHALRDRPLVG